MSAADRSMRMLIDYQHKKKYGASVVAAWPKSVPFSMLCEVWAQNNHSQTLTRLNERGGLCPAEMLANIERRKFRMMDANEATQIITRLMDVRAAAEIGRAVMLREGQPAGAAPESYGFERPKVASVDTPEFREALLWFANACRDPYSKLETKAVEQTKKFLIDVIDTHCAQQVAPAAPSARPARKAGPCKCGQHQIPDWADVVSWYWQKHGRTGCTLELPNERCECGLLRSEHITGHAETTSEAMSAKEGGS